MSEFRPMIFSIEYRRPCEGGREMKWIGVITLLICGCILLTGCDRELRAQEQTVEPPEPPDAPTIALREISYWDELVYGDPPSFEGGAVTVDPFDPLIVTDLTKQNNAQIGTAAGQMSTENSTEVPTSVPIEITGIIQGQRPVAILRVNGSELLVEVGEHVIGYKVEAIQDEKVILVRDEKRRVLEFAGLEWNR